MHGVKTPNSRLLGCRDGLNQRGFYPVQDELDLVRRARQGDKEAFTLLYEGHFERIYRYIVTKIGNKPEAEDLTQQVFIRAYESIGAYRHQGFPFSSWLFRIAHNQAVDFIRRDSKKPTVYLDETIPVAGSSNPEREVEIKLSMEKVTEASQGLSKAQREVISLRFAGGLSIAECAKTMGKSEGAIKALQHSAIQSLRKTLKKEIQGE
jgi:RNA polymerase sigma-70 factor (ECF subfamily)